MPRHHIVVETPIVDSFRVSAMKGMFDVSLSEKMKHSWDVDLKIDDMNWNVGLIVGSSGSGKTTIAKHFFSESEIHCGYEWDSKKSILDNFPNEIDLKQITTYLCHVGFSSPPSWVKPFNVLSNGEKFRVELARILAEERKLIVVDEFTSVIDRNSAMVGSYAISKTIKKTDKKIVALSCHRDIIEWLEPDWVYDTDANTFTRGLLRRPEIKLEVFSVERKAWELFRKHHYLTSEIAPAAQCFVAFLNGHPVCFFSYVHSAGYFGIKREHRTVVLPDFQGVNIGNICGDWLADYCKKKGFRYTSTFSHPSLIHQRKKSGKWKFLHIGHQSCGSAKSLIHGKSNSGKRVTVRAEYIGK